MSTALFKVLAARRVRWNSRVDVHRLGRDGCISLFGSRAPVGTQPGFACRHARLRAGRPARMPAGQLLGCEKDWESLRIFSVTYKRLRAGGDLTHTGMPACRPAGLHVRLQAGNDRLGHLLLEGLSLRLEPRSIARPLQRTQLRRLPLKMRDGILNDYQEGAEEVAVGDGPTDRLAVDVHGPLQGPRGPTGEVELPRDIHRLTRQFGRLLRLVRRRITIRGLSSQYLVRRLSVQDMREGAGRRRILERFGHRFPPQSLAANGNSSSTRRGSSPLSSSSLSGSWSGGSVNRAGGGKVPFRNSSRFITRCSISIARLR